MSQEVKKQRPVSIPARVAVAATVVAGGFEMMTYSQATGAMKGPIADLLMRHLETPWLRYLLARNWVFDHPWLTGVGGAAAAGASIAAWLTSRRAWDRRFGPEAEQLEEGFEAREVDLMEELKRRPKGTTFVGLTPSEGLWGRRWKPVYLTDEERTMHRHVLGKTGSGKTRSVLWPQVLQDALDGKAVVVMDAKGSDENVRMMKAIGERAGRTKDVRVFCLPAWNQPKLFSHTYNLFSVRLRGTLGPDDPGGDAAAAAERVFATLKLTSLGDNIFYNTQAELMFTNVVKLLHGMVEGPAEGPGPLKGRGTKGRGIPFCMRDVSTVLKGLGADPDDGPGRALQMCLEQSVDRAAIHEINGQRDRLGGELHQCMSGLIGAVDKLLSPLCNAYAPDIDFEQVLEQKQLVYIQLPVNLFKLQAPTIGRTMLMDLQQQGGMRQVFRRERNQDPVSINLDEFANFAELSVLDSLNKLRDANFQFSLFHQSLADLELVSKEFARAVWDNTRTRDVLSQDNPELCEQLARSIGTVTLFKKTWKMERGLFFAFRATGQASMRSVDEYRLHPNRLKRLARAGQGYLVSPSGRLTEPALPICYPMMPELSATYPLERNDQTRARGLRLYEKYLQDWNARPNVSAVRRVKGRVGPAGRGPRPRSTVEDSVDG